jgi:hypothetical protein
MSKNNHKRTFKLKRYPSEEIDGITHVYPPVGAKTTKVVERDRLYFLANPGVRSYSRPYVPGEFDGVQIPKGMQLSDITQVKVIRMGESGQARIPYTKERGNNEKATS